jgi:hypothetical protein
MLIRECCHIYPYSKNFVPPSEITRNPRQIHPRAWHYLLRTLITPEKAPFKSISIHLVSTLHRIDHTHKQSPYTGGVYVGVGLSITLPELLLPADVLPLDDCAELESTPALVERLLELSL